MAKLVSLKETPKKPVFASAKGDLTVPDNFTDSDPEIEELLYNGPIFPK